MPGEFSPRTPLAREFPPRPAPPPGRTAAPRPPRANGAENKPETRTDSRQSILADQYIRLQASRLAIDRYRGKNDVTDDQILATADRIAEFVSRGKTTTEGPRS